MKWLALKGCHCSISGSIYPVQGSTDCALALYFNDDHTVKSHCPIKVTTITRNSVTQLSSDHYLISVILSSSRDKDALATEIAKLLSHQ